jgi:hypothetical protein
MSSRVPGRPSGGACVLFVLTLLVAAPAIAAIQPIQLDDASVSLSPNPPVRGELATLTIRVPNRSTVPFDLTAEGQLGVAALLAPGARNVSVRGAPQPLRSLVSKPMVIAPGSAATLTIPLILRDEPAGPLVLRLTLETRHQNAWASRRDIDLQVEPVWAPPEVLPSRRGYAFVLLLLVLWALALPTVVWLWRAARGAATKHRTALRAGALIVAVAAFIAAALVSVSAWSDFSTSGRYREGRCLVSDVTVADRGRTRGTSGPSVQWYGLVLAVEVQRAGSSHAAIIGDSDRRGSPNVRASEVAGQLSRYRVGGTYPCWHDPEHPKEATMTLETSSVPYGFGGALLALLSLPGAVALFRRRNERGAA